MSNQENIKISVCMITYNHQDFISQALDSILNQKTTFSFEIVIGNDGSKDNTGRICASYASRFPDKIKYYDREENIGMMPNFIQTLRACDGKYIAICEGDDYWVDENKLQEQADFLETNPDFSLCCHNHFVYANNKLIPANKHVKEDRKVIKTENYLLQPFFHMASYFFRNNAQPKPFPDWYKDVLAGDHFLVLFLSVNGKIGYLNKRMSVFRNHGSSVTFTRTALEIKRNFVYHLELFDNYSGSTYHATIQRVIHKWDLLYKVYEPVGYFKKLSFLFVNTRHYLQNFNDVGGLKLLIKYLVPNNILRWVKG